MYLGPFSQWHIVKHLKCPLEEWQDIRDQITFNINVSISIHQIGEKNHTAMERMCICVVCTQDQWCCVTQMHHQRIQTLRQVCWVFEVLLDACHAAHFPLDVQHKSRQRQTHMLSVSVVTHFKSHNKLLKLYYYLWVLCCLQKHRIQMLLEFCSYCYWFKEFERLCKTRTPWRTDTGRTRIWEHSYSCQNLRIES